MHPAVAGARKTATLYEALAAAESEDEQWTTPKELADARSILTADNDHLALPDRIEIDEYHMMDSVARAVTDAPARDAALTALRGGGAFRYFKDTVHHFGHAASWYEYRGECYRGISHAWCSEHGLNSTKRPLALMPKDLMP